MSRRGRSSDTLERLPDELDSGSKLVGIDDEGSMVYYDPIREVTLSAAVPAEDDLPALEELPSPTESHSLSESSLAEFVEEIEHTSGWQALSEFAREKLDTTSD